MSSYHKKEITKGTLGEFSKIQEEFDELKDGFEQEHVVLQLCEMADLLGAIEAYASKYNVTLDDLIQMKNSTKSAFENGDRISEPPVVKQSSGVIRRLV